MRDPERSRRAKGEGQWHKRADGRLEWRGPIGDDPRHSVIARKGETTKIQVMRRVNELRRQAARGTRENRESVKDYLTRWLAERRPYLEPKTYSNYEINCRVHLIPALGRHRLDRLTERHVQALLSRLLAAGKKPGTVGGIRTTLKIALEPLVARGDLPRNVARLAEVPASEHEASPFSREEAARFRDAIHGDRFEALFIVALSCGLRLGEVTGLRWEDVDLDTGATHLCKQLQRQQPKGEPGRFVHKSLKGDRTRRVTLPAFALVALRDYRERFAVAHPWGLVFTHEDGREIYGQFMSKHIGRMLQRAGLGHRTMHDLRHSAASLLALSGATPFEIQHLLGHANVSITSRTYVHQFEEGRQRVADLMEGVFRLGPPDAVSRTVPEGDACDRTDTVHGIAFGKRAHASGGPKDKGSMPGSSKAKKRREPSMSKEKQE